MAALLRMRLLLLLNTKVPVEGKEIPLSLGVQGAKVKRIIDDWEDGCGVKRLQISEGTVKQTMHLSYHPAKSAANENKAETPETGTDPMDLDSILDQESEEAKKSERPMFALTFRRKQTYKEIYVPPHQISLPQQQASSAISRTEHPAITEGSEESSNETVDTVMGDLGINSGGWMSKADGWRYLGRRKMVWGNSDRV